jgi:hypothetical protein
MSSASRVKYREEYVKRASGFYVSIFLLALLFSLVPGRQAANSGDPQHELFLPLLEEQLPPIIPATTNILSDATTQYLTSVSGNGSVFTFSQMTAALQGLQAGDVMVSGDTNNEIDVFVRETGVY